MLKTAQFYQIFIFLFAMQIFRSVYSGLWNTYFVKV